jgi:hypothetical protein
MRFDLTSKKIPLTASQNLIAKLFGQQPVNLMDWNILNLEIFRSLDDSSPGTKCAHSQTPLVEAEPSNWGHV